MSKYTYNHGYISICVEKLSVQSMIVFSNFKMSSIFSIHGTQKRENSNFPKIIDRIFKLTQLGSLGKTLIKNAVKVFLWGFRVDINCSNFKNTSDMGQAIFSMQIPYSRAVLNSHNPVLDII